MQIPLIKTGDVNTDRMFTQMKSTLDPLLAVKLTQGNLIQATLKTGDNQVAHLLQRQPQGWIITDQTAGVTIYRTSWDSNYLVLNASAPVNIGLWVF